MARILLVQLSSLELNSYQILSAVLKRAGHEVAVCSLGLERYHSIVRFAKSWNPLAIGYTVTSFDVVQTMQLASRLRADACPGAHVVVGGPHAIISPMEVVSYDCVDSVCICEGEEVICELAASLQQCGQAPHVDGLWIKSNGAIRKAVPRPFIDDLGTLPLDDRSIYYTKYPMLCDAPFKVFTVGRGCSNNCSYCSNGYLKKLIPGKLVRYRPVHQVIEEITAVRAKYPLEYVMFRSDAFTAHAQWCAEFCEAYAREIRLPFYVQVVARQTSEEMLEAMARAGLTNIVFAIESGNERIRREILHRPPTTNDELLRLAGCARKKGIRVTTQEMFAIPTETLDDAFLTIDLNVRMRARMIPTVLQPYLHTEITRYFPPESLSMTEGTHYTAPSRLRGKDVGRIVVLQRFAGWVCRFPWPLYRRLRPVLKLCTAIPDNPLFCALAEANFFFVNRRLTNYAGSFLFFVRFALAGRFSLRPLKTAKRASAARLHKAAVV